MDLTEGGRSLLLVHQRIPVRIDGSEPPRYAKELERAEGVSERVAVPVGTPQE
ncbi:hypothetical protein [Streptomyces sp. NPDC086782]|uniref:hypothetical protein n=1 Tax=Streptomyces sp. NPDC086782 TaxID=3365757 RepID=UPI0038289FFD